MYSESEGIDNPQATLLEAEVALSRSLADWASAMIQVAMEKSEDGE